MNWLRLVFILLVISGLTASCATKSGKEHDEMSREYKYRDMPPAWGGSYGGK
jgi:hypothetical protein